MRYHDYLSSPEWKATREWAIRQRGARCEHCEDESGPFDVHHVSYGDVGAEGIDDLRVLCRDCHALVHYDLDVIRCRDIHDADRRVRDVALGRVRFDEDGNSLPLSLAQLIGWELEDLEADPHAYVARRAVRVNEQQQRLRKYISPQGCAQPARLLEQKPDQAGRRVRQGSGRPAGEA